MLHTSAYVSIRQHTYVSIRQHTSAYVSKRSGSERVLPMLLTIHNTGMLNLAGAVSTEGWNVRSAWHVRQCVACVASSSPIKPLLSLYEASMKPL